MGVGRDIPLALGSICVGAVVLWGLKDQPRTPFDPLGAAAIPSAVAVLVILIAGAIVLKRLMAMRREQSEGEALAHPAPGPSEAGGPTAMNDAVRPGLSAITILAAFAYAAAIPLLGFAIASVAFLTLLGWSLGDRSRRMLITSVVIAIILGFGLDYGFTAMSVMLP